MAIPVYLQGFKAAGIYRVVFDKSTVLNQDSSILRMVVGYSDKGPFNTPVYVRTVGDFRSLFGDQSNTLEKRGDFFHRTAIQMLAAGPILALNLKKFENEKVGGTQIDTTFNTDYALTPIEIPVEDVYDTTRFWELSADKLNEIRGAEYINIATTNTKALSGTYFIRKASGSKVNGWNISVRDWYADANEDIPEYLLGKENQLMSAFMAEIYVFKGRFTADQVLASSTLKKYFEMNLDGKLILKQYVTNSFGDYVDTLDALYNDENSGAIGHYVGSLIPYLKDKNGVYSSLDIQFNQDQDVHNMMMAFNTDMLEEDGTAEIDLSGSYNISTHDTGNQHDQGHKFAAGNVPYGAKPLCLDDIFDGIAVTNLLGNTNSPIVSDVVEFRTSLYTDDDVVKNDLAYEGTKKVTGSLYVSKVSGSNITLSHVGNGGAEQIVVDAAAADDVNYILYQLGAAYEYTHANDDYTATVTEYIPYESGLGTYFEGVNAYDLPTNLQGPKRIITSISRDLNTDDDTILLAGNKIKCTIEDVYITTKSQYKSTLVGGSVKIVSDEDYEKMLVAAGYGSSAELAADQYISFTAYSKLLNVEKAKYRKYSEIVAYQKYDYNTKPQVVDNAFLTANAKLNVVEYSEGADCTVKSSTVLKSVSESGDETFALSVGDVVVVVDNDTDTEIIKVDADDYSYVDANGVLWHAVGDYHTTKTKYTNSATNAEADATVSCGDVLYYHAVIPFKEFEDKALNDEDYAGYSIKTTYPAVSLNATRYYDSLVDKSGWKPCYDETKWYLITDADLLNYTEYKWINRIEVDDWAKLGNIDEALQNNYRAGYDVVAYQKYDYVAHFATNKDGSTNTALVDLDSTGSVQATVTNNTYVADGITWHLVIDEKCSKLLYAHAVVSIENYETLEDKSGWRPIYQITYYYRIITNNAYSELPEEGALSDDDVTVGKDGSNVYSVWKTYQWINGSLTTNESWNVYGSSITFVGVDQTVWNLETEVTVDDDADLITYTFKADAADDTSLLAYLQKGDALLAEDATTDSDGDGEYDDEVLNGLYDICYVQETGTDYDDYGVPTTYWVKFTGKPAIYTRDKQDYIVVIDNSLNQEIGEMEPQYLKGYTYAHPKPEGTGMMAKVKWQQYMLSALTDYKGLRTGLLNKSEIDYRYIVDGFETFIQSGAKKELSFLAKEKQSAFAILNAPSVRSFVKCPYTSFVDDNGVFNVDYVVKGYNKKKAAVTRFDLPSADEGASFCAFYTPLKFSDGYIDTTVPSAGLVSNLFMEKYSSRQPYYIVAGPNYGAISASGLIGPDYHYSNDELQVIEPFGINCMVYRPGFGTFINANQTAKQTPVSALSKVHIRELVIYLQDEIEKILQMYQWEFNNQTVRNKIKDRADYICNQIKANGGLIDFVNVMDESNNTPEIIDNEMAILSTHIEPGRGMGKMVHELTLYKTGEMRSSIAGE
jgi:hypothetical protein